MFEKCSCNINCCWTATTTSVYSSSSNASPNVRHASDNMYRDEVNNNNNVITAQLINSHLPRLQIVPPAAAAPLSNPLLHRAQPIPPAAGSIPSLPGSCSEHVEGLATATVTTLGDGTAQKPHESSRSSTPTLTPEEKKELASAPSRSSTPKRPISQADTAAIAHELFSILPGAKARALEEKDQGKALLNTPKRPEIISSVVSQ